MSRLLIALFPLLAGCYESTGDDVAAAEDPSGEPAGPPNEARYVGHPDCKTEWVVLLDGAGQPSFRPSGWTAERGRLQGDLGWVLDLESEVVTVFNGLPNLFESGEEVLLEAVSPTGGWGVSLDVLLFGGAGHVDFAAGTSATYSADAPPEPADGRAFVTVIGAAGTADTRYFFLAADTVDVVVTDGERPGARRFDLDARFTVPETQGCPEPGDHIEASFELSPE
jgi:hypothetical protein